MSTAKLSSAAVVLVLGLTLLLVALVLGLVALAGRENVQDVLSWVSSVGVILSGAGSGGAFIMARRSAQQTNGSLDTRIKEQVRMALQEYLVLPQAGANPLAHATLTAQDEPLVSIDEVV